MRIGAENCSTAFAARIRFTSDFDFFMRPTSTLSASCAAAAALRRNSAPYDARRSSIAALSSGDRQCSQTVCRVMPSRLAICAYVMFGVVARHSRICAARGANCGESFLAIEQARSRDHASKVDEDDDTSAAVDRGAVRR